MNDTNINNTLVKRMAIYTLEEYKKKKKKKESDIEHAVAYKEYMEKNEIAPVKSSSKKTVTEDIAPVKKSLLDKMKEGVEKSQQTQYGSLVAPIKTQTSGNWQDEGGIIKKASVFNDGYQIGDVSKTILGTTADVGLNVAKGAGNLVEGLGDAFTYGVAGVANMVGNKKATKEMKEHANKNYINDNLADTQDFLSKYSMLGDASKGIAEGLGYVGGMIGAGALGGAAGLGVKGVSALTTGVTGLSSMGSGMGEAYQSGATDKEAVTYGAIKGVVDAGTEMIFGGLGKSLNAIGIGRGLSSADDMLAKKISSKLSNTIAKNLVEFGIKAGAEGTEEVLAGIGSAIGKKVTYMSEEELGNIVEDEDLLGQFLAGAVTSGIVQSGYIPGMKNGSLREANKAGRDFITGYSVNEQNVINKEIENRIAAEEKDGKQLTKKEKTAIEERVQKDLEKGYISIDTIESTLGGDTYKSYDELNKQEKALKEEFDTLNKMKQGEMTGEQIDRRNELKEQISKFDETTNRGKMREQLSKEVKEMIANDRYLAESYNESGSIDSATKYLLKEEVENVSDNLTSDEWFRFKTAVANYTKLNHHYEKSSDGDIIIPIDNKLVYTDADYDSPGISRVIEFDSDVETEIDEARGWIYEAEKGKFTLSDAYEIIETITGNEFISEYNQKSSESAEKYDRRTSRGKSQSDSYHSGFMQDRIGRANEIINRVNNEASSEGDAFSNTQKMVENQNTTDDQSGNLSLSKTEQDIAPVGSYSVYGKDIALEKEQSLVQKEGYKDASERFPIRKDVDTNTKEAQDIAPLKKNEINKQDTMQSDYKTEEVTKEEKALKRSELHKNIVDRVKETFHSKGFDFDEVLNNAKNLSTFSTVDNTPQRVMEKALGYKEGQVLSDLTVNQVAQNESAGVKWLNSQIETLRQISKEYDIKPGSKESAAAQMYAEGFYTDDKNNLVKYGDAELETDFKNPRVRENIKKLANDSRIRQIYDDTLSSINDSRTRNAYPASNR